jgi:hypothetical protein
MLPEQSRITVDTIVALIALAVSVLSFGYSFYFWRRSFRPIVTAMVKTHGADSGGIYYDLVLLNSGTIPAKNVSIKPDPTSLAAAFGRDATEANQRRWLAAFDPTNTVSIIHNGDRVLCSFGETDGLDGGFWKYKSKISVTIEYEGWFGKKYKQAQEIQIIDSDSFTGFMW